MGKGYYHTPESVEEYIRLAEPYDGHELINQLRKYLHEGSAVLELGSGPGKDFNLLSKRFETMGSDISSEFINYLNEQFPEGKFLTLDAISIGTDRTFDAIYSNKVLHHLTNEELQQSVQRQAEILNPGGWVCHSFWKGEGEEMHNGLLVNHHTEEELEGYFNNAFEMKLMEVYREFEDDDSLLFIGQKK